MLVFGILAIIVGFLMIFEVGFFRGLEDIGVVIFIVGFLSLSICFMSVSVNASGKYPTAGITEVMIKATSEPLTVSENEVTEVAAEEEISYEEAIQFMDDAELLARLITAEVGYSTAYDPIDYEDACYLTGSVVINRMKSDKFPDTLRDVINQSGQYAVVDNGMINRPYDDIAYEVSEELLSNGTTVDEGILWQATFPQGDGVYRVIGNTYFCYSGD